MAEHKHEEEHGLYSGEPIYHGREDERGRLDHEILADRERVFATFVRWSAWNVVLIFLILAFLAITQT